MYTSLAIIGTYAVLLLPYVLEEPYRKTLKYITKCKCGVCQKKDRKINYTDSDCKDNS